MYHSIVAHVEAAKDKPHDHKHGVRALTEEYLGKLKAHGHHVHHHHDVHHDGKALPPTPKSEGEEA